LYFTLAHELASEYKLEWMTEERIVGIAVCQSKVRKLVLLISPLKDMTNFIGSPL
jgi:hypothetical protein